jgi:hypothetical protein
LFFKIEIEMKLRKPFNIALAAGLLLSALACNRSDDDPPPTTTCTAGLGGGLTIVAFPKHHTKTIFNQTDYPDTVFVKFNTQDSPGPDLSSYDTFFVGEAGEDHVHLPNLKCGKYYLLATGFDTSIHQRVIGGIPFNTDLDSTEVDVNIPVTEGD